MICAATVHDKERASVTHADVTWDVLRPRCLNRMGSPVFILSRARPRLAKQDYLPLIEFSHLNLGLTSSTA
jgi:hypothetical protein